MFLYCLKREQYQIVMVDLVFEIICYDEIEY